jgi:protein-L-isoaspartate(D-aspartate) O-methyltransferase
MTQELCIQKGDKVLEIGTGSGYQAAVLCKIGVKLYSIEIKNELYKKAKSLFQSLKYSAVLKNGDGSCGWNAYSPYSAIIVTAGVKIVPNELFGQLKDGGKIVVPIGKKDKQILTIFTKNRDEIIEKTLTEFSFVPMTGVKGLEN